MHYLIDCVNYLSVVALMQANILRVTEIISSIVSTILSVVAVMQTDIRTWNAQYNVQVHAMSIQGKCFVTILTVSSMYYGSGCNGKGHTMSLVFSLQNSLIL